MPEDGSPDLWRPATALVLASGSITRRLLLESAGLSPVCDPADIDERSLEAASPAGAPPDLALRLAEAKASTVAQRWLNSVVIGADQVLALDSEVFHKPAGSDEAAAHLARLAGRTHHLHSAVAIAEGGRIVDRFVETARLTMRALNAEAIAAYVALAGPARVTSSVGAYQIEGLGIHLFSRIEGDHSTILGLPLLPLLSRLRQRGWLRF